MLDFTNVFEKNKHFIFRYLMKLCGDTSLAEELTQETFYRAYMNLAALRSEEKVTVWLCSIARNTYLAWYNSNKKQRAIERMPQIEDTPDIATLFEETETAGRAFECLHSLGEPYKEVFMLCTFGGLSLKAISQLFGKSESWARVTYHRAKLKIIEELEK